MRVTYLSTPVIPEEGTSCPICLEEEGAFIGHENGGENHPIHPSCLKDSVAAGYQNCPTCRAPIDFQNSPALEDYSIIPFSELPEQQQQKIKMHQNIWYFCIVASAACSYFIPISIKTNSLDAAMLSSVGYLGAAFLGTHFMNRVVTIHRGNTSFFKKYAFNLLIASSGSSVAFGGMSNGQISSAILATLGFCSTYFLASKIGKVEPRYTMPSRRNYSWRPRRGPTWHLPRFSSMLPHNRFPWELPRIRWDPSIIRTDLDQMSRNLHSTLRHSPNDFSEEPTPLINAIKHTGTVAIRILIIGPRTLWRINCRIAEFIRIWAIKFFHYLADLFRQFQVAAFPIRA